MFSSSSLSGYEIVGKALSFWSMLVRCVADCRGFNGPSRAAPGVVVELVQGVLVVKD